MKTFRLIGMALLAIVMCANFTACSSSDDDDKSIKDEDGIITNQKRLVEMRETYEDDEDDTNITKYSYDSKGKLISVVRKDYDIKYSDFYNFTWGENSIKISEDDYSYEYSINDGLVRSGSGSGSSYVTTYSYAYNSSKQLTTYQERWGSYSSSTETKTLTWENGKVAKIVSVSSSDQYVETTEFTYGNQTTKGYFPLTTWLIEDDSQLMLAHPELFGMRYTHLPIRMVSSEGDSTDFTYILNKDGYVESCTLVRTYGSDVDTTNYTFKWE